jgi:hypothetical protein
LVYSRFFWATFDESLAAGVAIGSAAEAAGVTPGQRLVALSDPVNSGELWFITGSVGPVHKLNPV